MMRRLFLVTVFTASIVFVFAVPQAALASGQDPLTGASSPSSGPPSPTPVGVQSTIYPNHYPWGYCTWWAAQTRLTENLEGLGNANMWAINAAKRGLRVGTTPVVGATVVFAPWVQGAWSLGHVAHVIAVNGTQFEVSEMNFYGGTPKGGFGKVDYRWAHTGSGVSFIY